MKRVLIATAAVVVLGVDFCVAGSGDFSLVPQGKDKDGYVFSCTMSDELSEEESEAGLKETPFHTIPVKITKENDKADDMNVSGIVEIDYMRAGLLFRADKFSNSCLIHLYPMLTTHNASSAPICLIQGIEGKFYPVGKYGFSLYQVDESLMSFTDGIKRSILVSGDGIHIVPSEEIQQYLKNFVITQKSIGSDEPPAEVYFDTEIGASTLTGKRIMREGGRDVPLLARLGYFALGERPLSAEMLPPALGTAFRYLEEAEAKTSSVPSLSGEADVPAQTTPISSASSSSSSSIEDHPIFRLNYCGRVPAQFGHEMQQGADIWSLGIILYEQMLRRGAEIPSAGLPSLDAISPLYQNLMRESGLLPMFMLNPAEHHHEANLFGRLGEKKDDILPPTSTTSLVSPTNAVTADTSSGSSSVSATVAVHPDYNSMIDERGHLSLVRWKFTSFDISFKNFGSNNENSPLISENKLITPSFFILYFKSSLIRSLISDKEAFWLVQYEKNFIL